MLIEKAYRIWPNPMEINYQTNSRDFCFCSTLPEAGLAQTLLHCWLWGPDAEVAAEWQSRSVRRCYLAEGQWTNPGGNAGRAAAARRAMEWQWHTGTQSYLLLQHSPGSAQRWPEIPCTELNVCQGQPLPQPQGSNAFSGMRPIVKLSEMFSSAQYI